MKNITNIVFYKLYKHFEDFYQALIVLTGIMLMNLFSVYLILVTMGVFNIKNYKNDTPFDRFVVGPIIIGVFCLPLYFYFKKNNYYLKIVEEMEALDTVSLKRNNYYFWMYVLGSIFVLFGSILSGFILDLMFGK
jgi:hypothetical protein